MRAFYCAVRVVFLACCRTESGQIYNDESLFKRGMIPADKNGKITIIDVARKAGVSKGTVDRVLHGRGRVKAEVQERVCRIAREMQYQPNAVGQALVKSSAPKKLGIICQFSETPFMKLVAAGKMKLTDNLSKYYPNNPYSGITIHHLLCHTSGLPEYFDFPEEIWGTEGFVTNEQAIQKVFSRREKIFFKPGMRYKYTNTNYLLLADIVAKVSGVKFEKFMEDSIFKPIGMDNTFYVTQKSEHKDIFFPRGHLKSGEEVAIEPLDGTFGDKGLYSCPEALMKWKIAFFNEYTVLPKEWVEKASSPQNKLITGAAPSELYGYGFHLEENPYYGKLVYHGGLWHGFHHIMVYRPSDNLLFICLSNYRNRAHIGKSNQILNILDGV